MFKVGEIVKLYNSDGDWEITGISLDDYGQAIILELRGVLSKNILFENAEDVELA